LKVGLITNDQAGGLVDTKLLRGQGFANGRDRGRPFLLPVQDARYTQLRV